MNSPSFTIVTPSYQQADFIEETIQSVLGQDYPHYEYYVIDGGSDDGSKEIIARYEDRLAGWVSEPDQGQHDAINKGFRHGQGDIFYWVNSDDQLAPGALRKVAETYRQGLHWYTGSILAIKENTTLEAKSHLNDLKNISAKRVLRGWVPFQTATFWNRELWEATGSRLSNYYLALDYDLWHRFAQKADPIAIPDYLGIVRFQENAKTADQTAIDEYFQQCESIRYKYARNRKPALFWRNYYRLCNILGAHR